MRANQGSAVDDEDNLAAKLKTTIPAKPQVQQAVASQDNEDFDPLEAFMQGTSDRQ